MSLKCSYVECARNYELASGDQLAFYQDVNNGGWNLGLKPEYTVDSQLPPNISLINTGKSMFPYEVVCNRCQRKVGKVNEINGFQQLSINFAASKTVLLQNSFMENAPATSSKWSKIIQQFPQIQRLTAKLPEAPPVVGENTIHFHSRDDFMDMIKPANSVAARSYFPRRYQWRAYFFACLQNTLLCLPTGMGKTLIANMLMKAYHQLNPKKAQVFIVPTVVLVEQQAGTIERNTGLKVMKRSSEHNTNVPWRPNEICVCTPAMLVTAFKMKQIDMSQISLLVFDEVHEASSEKSQYGLILPYIEKCFKPHRPRILSLTASPSGVNIKTIRESILLLCQKLDSMPFSPLVDDEKSNVDANQVNCEFIEIKKTPFEMGFETFVFDTLEKLSKLHPHFVSNWTEVSSTAEIHLRVNAIDRVLSHSEVVARNSEDNVLFQVTMYMKKWSASLDLLRVFGPQMLFEFIRSDLKFTEKNDSLSHIKDQVMEMIPGFLEKMLEIESLNTAGTDASRASTLIAKLKEHQSETSRIIVFVERRTTAERLCRRLQEDQEVSSMNPEYLVGNSATSSSATKIPKERQKEIMQKFRDGQCKLLVATSVLEQGIDVAACNVVICFDGVKSLKSIIQARGRARNQSASFVVFVSTGGRERMNQLTLKESEMNQAIQQLMYEKNSRIDADMEEEIDNFLDENNREIFTNEDNEIDDLEEEEEDDDDLDELEDNNVINLRFFNFIDQDALIDHVSSFFTTSTDRLKINKRYIYAKFISKDDVQARSNLIRNISTYDSSNTDFHKATWIQTSTFNDLKKLEVKAPKAFMTFSSLTGFFFRNSFTVCTEGNYIWYKHIKVQIENNEIMIGKGNEFFIITAFDVSGPILINENNNFLDIFLCLANPPKFYKQRERAHFNFNDRSFNLRLRSDNPADCDDVWHFRKALESFSLEVYNVANLKEVVIKNYDEGESRSFEKSYLIKAWHSKHAAVLPPKLDTRTIQKLDALSVTNLNLVLENNFPERFHKLYFYDLKETTNLPFDDITLPSNFFMVGRIKVTPSRFIFMPMVATPKNRIFRYYPNPENFVIVSLTDEHEENPWQSQAVYDWFVSVLMNGIEIAGKTYTFLGCSNSQLREGHCWFSCLDREEVYEKIGVLPDSMNAGRKLTRLALAFAASQETVPLNHENYIKNVGPDVEIEGKCFSDGIGRGSRRIFKRITDMLGLKSQPSAFQIRVAGIKGVISVFDDLQDDVMFRDSMKKFESDHNMLEVLEYSKPIKLCLNRHVILLLSNFGVPDEVFLELQFEELEKVMIALTNHEQSIEFVKSSSEVIPWELIPRNKLAHEPMFREILFSNSIDLFAKIVDRAHLFVEKGRVLMGVLDETNTLEYGEVYARIVEKDLDMEVDGEVIVFRNPSVLPSDIRRLNARTKNLPQRFRDLYKNCLVIPATGSSCHAHECSGGDLDGDLYYIIWEEKLMPANLPKPGEKVLEVETTTTKVPTGNSVQDMIEFFCDYSQNFQLGIIANAHLATADKLGMRDQQSIELARYVTAETDAPKKGLSVGRIKAELVPKEYPDFMRKGDKPSYQSTTVLGELFREANPLLEVLIETRTKTKIDRKISMKSDENSIEGFYSLYSFEIKRMLQSFSLPCEADLFSGTPMWPNGFVSNYKQQNQLRQTVVEHAQAFWKKWRGIFEEWLVKVKNDQEKIRDWYNRPKSCKWPVHSFSLLAMPFVDFDASDLQTITDSIQKTTRQWLNSKKFDILKEFGKRQNVGQAVMDKLQGIPCHFYGSSMLGLSEEYSDIDLFADDRDFTKLSNMLRELDENAVALEKPHRCVNLTFDSCAVDVTNFSEGVKKTYALAETFDEHPGLWPALRVLVEWARNAKIIKSGGSAGLMTVVSFCHLFVYFATSAMPKLTDQQIPYTNARIGNWIDSVKDSKCGAKIFGFLKMLSDRRIQTWISTRVDPINDEKLVNSMVVVKELRKSAEIAIFSLAVHDGNILKLFQFCTKKRLFRIHSCFMNPLTISEEKKNDTMKEIEEKCNPKKCHHMQFNLIERNGVFYLEVTGDNKHFLEVEREINKIQNRILCVRYNGLNNKIYHIQNATLIIPEKGRGDSTVVTFSMFDGKEFQAQHYGMSKTVLEIRSSDPDDNWKESEFVRYQKRFSSQLELYRSKLPLAVKGTRHWRFFGELACIIRCGSHYFFNVPETMHNTFETTTLKQVEKNIAFLEEVFLLEQDANITKDMKKDNKLSVVEDTAPFKDEMKPLSLMPLKEAKRKSTIKRREIDAPESKATRRAMSMRNSFWPSWTSDLEITKEFATINGFRQVPLEEIDYSCSLSFLWRQRELKMICNRKGVMQSIKHRNTRWLSTTINHYDKKDGGDVRIYLEARADLDDEENVLEEIIKYLDGRSIFNRDFVLQIDRAQRGKLDDDEEFPTRPLIPEMLHFSWRFRSMRILCPLIKFSNDAGDILVMHEVHDGIFNEAKTFEWFEKHNEVEFKLSLERSDEELCNQSYDLAMKLFHFTKQ